MKTLSAGGRDLLIAFEGLRLKPYRDAVGIWTIGVGHVIRPHDSDDGSPLRGWKVPGFKLSRDQVFDLLDQDMYERELWFVEHGLEHLTQHQFDALLSLTFNCGTGWAHPDRVKRLQSGETAFMEPVFASYVKAGGRTLRGLVSRRKAEWEWFSLPDV